MTALSFFHLPAVAWQKGAGMPKSPARAIRRLSRRQETLHVD
jgi:hypothetical protein